MQGGCDLEALSAYLDGALSESESRAVEKHLADCAHCREELARFRDIQKLFCAWDPPSSPPFFVERLNLRLSRGSPTPGRRARPLWRLASAVLAAAVAAFLVYNLVSVPAPPTLDGFLNRFLDRDVLEITTFSNANLSRDRVLDLVLAGDSR